MQHFANPSLEDVFLELCLRDGDLDPSAKQNSGFEKETDIEMQPSDAVMTRRQSQASTALVVRLNSSGHHSMLQEPTILNHIKKPWTATSKREKFLSGARISALIVKNIINLTRNVMFLLLAFALPAIQTVLFCVTIGGTPKNLHVAVTNLDNGINFDNVIPKLNYSINIADAYLNELNDEIIIQDAFDTFDAGFGAVEDGDAWGLLYFPENFTVAQIFPDAYNVSERQIHVYMDNTNQQISYTILLQFFAALQRLVVDFASNNFTDVSIVSPLKIEDPVYGSTNPTFTEFMAPGVILTLSYFMAMSLTSVAFVIEKKEGLYNRALVAGVNNLEIMLAHLVTQLAVLIIQVAIILVFMFAVFNIPCEGSMSLVILLSLLQGLCGMTFGYFISVSVEDEMTAFQAAMGVFYPILLLSGIVWPVQGMPIGLQYISYALPQTYACDSIRAILYRGWNLTYFDVYFGFIVTIIWMAIH
ncbi:hypothetical protein HAZT_HAZT004598, partial [Hyalella azteca]